MHCLQLSQGSVFFPRHRKTHGRRPQKTPTALCSLATTHVEPRILELPSNVQGRITYQAVDSINFKDVSELLAKVDWPARQQSRLELALQNSYMLATLELHHPPQTTALIGMARVVSDGAFNAQIWDVIVDPAFQGMGLGRQLVSEIVKSLLREDIRNICTFAEKSGTKFYEKIGFQSDPDNVRGMFYRRML